MLKQILSITKIVMLAIVLSFGLSYALAWTSPTATPPGANVAAPLNAGDTNQVKGGGLTVGSLTTAGAVTAGSVSTTGLTNTGTLRVTGGAGATKVLTSDATGNATWQAAATGGGIDPAPIGSIVSYAGAAAPDGYLICNGASLLRTGTYASLFAAIGTTYGAVDGTHFNLPDLRGEFVRGFSNGRAGVDVGRILGSTQTQEIQSHAHQQTHNGSPLYRGALGGTYTLTVEYDNVGYYNTPVSTVAAGGTETRPRNVAMNYIIKAVNNSEMVLVSTAAADNLGNHTATQALSLGTNNIISSGADTALGSMTVQGAKAGYAGINFKDASGTLNYGSVVTSPSVAGFYNASDNAFSFWVTSAGLATAQDFYIGSKLKWASSLVGTTNVYSCPSDQSVACRNECVGQLSLSSTCTLYTDYGNGCVQVDRQFPCTYMGKLQP